mmetsp:Transcript_17002/g.24060  ORF Transcript_17002/g.24060 Transcript_17002/m.24060 type:complete len:541 (-) Transcript_17002:85-1707(-)|eukprot:CAMPEP_0184873196 /NCGR_PEP_ID=MMETSP0580-20130426/41707_1 /TAXON_ID=1118495 /ORGANISM="Dactyliosolen fragilissimus" /LENGTH=540 /DNA_ID=CAMNT_0027376073 /DNA_START=45 /DNA_END=1667 /DNA_ORIENTATION=-
MVTAFSTTFLYRFWYVFSLIMCLKNYYPRAGGHSNSNSGSSNSSISMIVDAFSTSSFYWKSGKQRNHFFIQSSKSDNHHFQNDNRNESGQSDEERNNNNNNNDNNNSRKNSQNDTPNYNDFNKNINHKYNERKRQMMVSRRASFSLSALPVMGMMTYFTFLHDSHSVANAIVTDETSAFANESSDSAYSSRNLGNANSNTNTNTNSNSNSNSNYSSIPTDEITVSIPIKAFSKESGGLGIELGETQFRTNRRVFVKAIAPNSPADKLGIQKDWIFVSIDGMGAERTDKEGVALLVSKALQTKSQMNPNHNIPNTNANANANANYYTNNNESDSQTITIVFRDNSLFLSQINNFAKKDGDTSASSSSSSLDTTTNTPPIASTKVAPSGDTTQRNTDGSIRNGYTETQQTDQTLSVTQLIPPRYCTRGAGTDDLLEISYIGTVLETGDIFDGSAIKINGEAIPGRANDVSLFFVLGKQPFGQFPPGWDVGLEGICVGERRRIVVPPVLAYGASGLPRRNIPPNATLQYDITLVSMNGLATPQ